MEKYRLVSVLAIAAATALAGWSYSRCADNSASAPPNTSDTFGEILGGSNDDQGRIERHVEKSDTETSGASRPDINNTVEPEAGAVRAPEGPGAGIVGPVSPAPEEGYVGEVGIAPEAEESYVEYQAPEDGVPQIIGSAPEDSAPNSIEPNELILAPEDTDPRDL